MSAVAREGKAHAMVGAAADSEYGNAGSTVGVEAWTIDRMEFVKVQLNSAAGSKVEDLLDPKKCYMVLHTQQKEQKATRGAPVLWTIHVWRGPQSSMIDGGIIGRRAVTLSRSLTRNASVHDCTVVYEESGDETDAFVQILGMAQQHIKQESDFTPTTKKESLSTAKESDVNAVEKVSTREIKTTPVPDNTISEPSVSNGSQPEAAIKPDQQNAAAAEYSWHVWKIRDTQSKRENDFSKLVADNGKGFVALNCYLVVEKHSEFGSQLFLWTGNMATATTRARARTEARAKAEKFSEPGNPVEVQHVHVGSDNPSFEELLWRMSDPSSAGSASGRWTRTSPKQSFSSHEEEESLDTLNTSKNDTETAAKASTSGNQPSATTPSRSMTSSTNNTDLSATKLPDRKLSSTSYQPTRVASSLLRNKIIQGVVSEKSQPKQVDPEPEPIVATSTVSTQAPQRFEMKSQKSNPEQIVSSEKTLSKSKHDDATTSSVVDKHLSSSSDSSNMEDIIPEPMSSSPEKTPVEPNEKTSGVAKVYDNLQGTMYQGAGKAQLDTWFVAGKKLVMAPSNSPLAKGTFYEQDSYMFLHTSEKTTKELKKRGGSPYNWTLYTWRGATASMIVNGFVGSRAIELRNLLIENGSFRDCELVRQTQGKESPEFLALFPENKVTVSPGQHKFSGFNKLGVQKHKPALFLQFEGMFTRVPIRTSSLDLIQGASFLLDVGNRVLVYAPAHCRRVDRAVTEELARSRAQKDYRKRWGDPVVVENDSNSEAYQQFMALLERHEEPEWNQVSKARSIGPMLWTLDDSGELVHVEQEAGPSGELEVPASRQLPHSLLNPSKVMILDCISEVFVWKGKHSTKQQLDDTVNKMNQRLIPNTSDLSPACAIRPTTMHQLVFQVADRFEPSYFIERFFGWPRATQFDKEAAKFEQEIRKFDKTLSRLRTPSMEVARLADFAPARAGDGYKDHTHPFDVSHIATEPNISSALRVWRVDKKGDLFELKGTLRGLFRSDATYLTLFSYKNASVNAVISWVGTDASRSERAAVTLKTQTLGVDLKATGPEYHSHLRQNAESLFFSTLLDTAGVPLVVVDGNQRQPRSQMPSMNRTNASQESATTRVLKVCLSPFGNTAHVVEEDFNLVASDGLSEDCSYVFVQRANVSPSSPFTAYCYSGSSCDSSVYDTFKAITSTSYLRTIVETMERKSFNADVKIGSINMIQMGPISRQREFPRLGINPTPIPWNGSQVRPMRLFEISWHKREVGGIFVEQVGTHRVDGSNNGNVAQFCQLDLKQNGSYLLDPGRSGPSNVYIWFGNSGLSDDARELAIEVGALYVAKVTSKFKKISSIRGFLDSQVSTSTDGAQHHRSSSRASNGGAGIRGYGAGTGAARGGNSSDNGIELEVVEFGREPYHFRSCFSGWRPITWAEKSGDWNDEASRRPSSFYKPIVEAMVKKANLSDEGRKKLDQRRRQSTLERFSEKTKKAMALSSIPRRKPGNPNRGADQSGFTLPRQLRTVTLKATGRGKFKTGFVHMMDRINSSLVSVGKRGSLHVRASAPFKIQQSIEDEVDATLEELSNGSINWCAYVYESETEMKLKGKGTDGFNEMLGSLDDAAASFALVRFKADELKSETVGGRVLFVQVIPDSLPPTRKAKIVSQKDAIREILAPYDTEYCVTSVSELSHDEAVEICSTKGMS